MPLNDSDDTDFQIYVDPSCLSHSMEEEPAAASATAQAAAEGAEQDGDGGRGSGSCGQSAWGQDLDENGETLKEAEGREEDEAIEDDSDSRLRRCADGVGAGAGETGGGGDGATSGLEDGNEYIEQDGRLTGPSATEEKVPASVRYARKDEVETENEAVHESVKQGPANLGDSDDEASMAEAANEGAERESNEHTAREPAGSPPHLFEDHSLVKDNQTEHRGVDERQQPETISDGGAAGANIFCPTTALEDGDETDRMLSSHRGSDISEQSPSRHTEALIHATARELVASLEAGARERSPSPASSLDGDGEEDREMMYDGGSEASRRVSSQSSGSQIHHRLRSSVSGDEDGGGGGDNSSSHPELDDEGDQGDAFSDLSSIGSMDEEETEETLGAGECPSPHWRKPFRRTDKSSDHPRASDMSTEYRHGAGDENEELSPAKRDAPSHMPFRSPSSLRALQLSSPTPSAIWSSRRRDVFPSETLPTVSRLGSPAGSGLADQRPPYSPNTNNSHNYPPRSPPSRLKPREAPLVLLHVTLMPLRWRWGELLDKLDAVSDDDGGYGGPGVVKTGVGKKQAGMSRPSDSLRMLRDSWRLLRDRVGDTVLERGILLPHPQDDYEVLEERLLEALELPLCRRARILECGHYLGPANTWHGEEDDDEGGGAYSEYDEDSDERRHWCNTCREEIQYENHGPEEVFDIEVYASNGLLGAGAWASCWKEMERVDAKIYPIVDVELHRELARVAANLASRERRQLQAESDLAAPCVDPAKHDSTSPPSSPSSPPRLAMMPSPLRASPLEPHSSSPIPVLPPPTYRSDPPDMGTASRSTSVHVDLPTVDTDGEARSSPSPRHLDSSYVAPSSSPSPSERALQRRASQRAGRQKQGREQEREQERWREHRRENGCKSGMPQHKSYATASLSELILESLRVALRDRKNVAIALLSVLVLVLAARPGPRAQVSAQTHMQDFESSTTPHAAILDTTNIAATTSTTTSTSTATSSSLSSTTAVQASYTPVSSATADTEPRNSASDTVPDTMDAVETASVTPISSDKTDSVEPAIATATTSSLTLEERLSASDDIPVAILEQETARVFETVTETVRVRVTMTETEVPQTSSSSIPTPATEATMSEADQEPQKAKSSDPAVENTIGPSILPANPVADNAVVKDDDTEREL